MVLTRDLIPCKCWQIQNSLTSDDVFHESCGNVSQCHQKPFLSGLHSRRYFTYSLKFILLKFFPIKAHNFKQVKLGLTKIVIRTINLSRFISMQCKINIFRVSVILALPDGMYFLHFITAVMVGFAASSSNSQ